MNARSTPSTRRTCAARAAFRILPFIAVFVLAPLVRPAPVAAQAASDAIRPAVYVEPLEVPADAPELATVAGVVTDTIALSLRLMGAYRVEAGGLSGDAPAASGPAPRDRTICGEAERLEDRSIRFSLRVEAAGTTDPVFETSYVADTLFDVFDVADRAVLALLEGLDRRIVRFGTLRVRPDAPGAVYAVSLDDTVLAEGLRGGYENPRVVNGRYRLRVRQERLTGDETILDVPVTVDSDAPAVVDVPVPALLPAEATWVAQTARDDAAAALQRIGEVSGVPAAAALRRYLESGSGSGSGNRTAMTTPDGVPPGWRPIPAVVGDAEAPRTTPLARAVPADLDRFVRSHFSEIDRFWTPRVSVHVAPDGTPWAGFSLDGLAGADRVTVEGVSGAEVSNVELEALTEDGGSASAPARYGHSLIEVPDLSAVDRFSFSIRHEGVDLRVEAAATGVPADLAQRERVVSTPDGYTVTWTPGGGAVQHTIVVSDEEHLMPAPADWMWSESVEGDAGELQIPRAAMSAIADRAILRVHVFSTDGGGNHTWISRRVHVRPYVWDITDIPRATPTIDGEDSDWAGVPPAGTPRPQTGRSRGDALAVRAFYLAADDEFFYWAIRTDGRDPRTFLPQIQIYNSVDARGANNGALLVIARNGRSGDVAFDHWNNPSLRRHYSEGVAVAANDTFLEMRIPRTAVDLNEFQINLVARASESGSFVRLVDNFTVRMP